MTSRGFWFFLTTLACLAAAVLLGSSGLVLIALSLLIWFLTQWFLFQWRRRVDFVVTRTLATSRGVVQSLWAGQRADVHVVLSSARAVELSYVLVSDRLPEMARRRDGLPEAEGPLASGKALELRYEIECPGPGRLRFEGLRVQLADAYGFFTAALFVRAPCEYRVLPRLATTQAHPTFVKQINVLPLLGTHRHIRAGTGGELLDLRDYLPGDPPKLIAWKASARRDRLMTKEFESEVPIRCTLFLDTSSSVRLGPVGATALGRLVSIAAAVAQSAAAERDLIGLCLFDEHGVSTLVRPARGPRHAVRLLDALTAAATLLPETTAGALRDLLPYAYALAQDVYPDLLRSDVNHVPFWLPLLAPQPHWTVARPPLRGRGVGSWLRRQARRLPLGLSRTRRSRFSGFYQRHYRWRKQLAAILAVRHNLGPGGLALLMEDDAACAAHLQRFLAEHQVASPCALYDDEGKYLFRSPEKLAVLARALVSAVTRGRDNELFVLCVDLFEASAELAPLERAVRSARARHHQVVAICPWPSGVAVPPGLHGSSMPVMETPTLPELLLRADTARLHQAFASVRHALGRLGVPVICAAERDTVDLILQRLQRLRIRQRGAP